MLCIQSSEHVWGPKWCVFFGGSFPSLCKISPKTPFPESQVTEKWTWRDPPLTCFTKIKYGWVKALSMKTNYQRSIYRCSNFKLHAIVTSGESDVKGGISLLILIASILFECFSLLMYYLFLLNRNKQGHSFKSCSHSGESWDTLWFVSDIHNLDFMLAL